MKTFFALFFSLFICATVYAAPHIDPAYRKLEFSANYPWSEGLALRFEVDEELCKKNYAKRWQIKCAAPFGRYGQPAKGIKLVPDIPGRWEWRGDRAIFIPRDEQSLQPNTKYRVNTDSLFLAPGIKLDTRKAQCATWPLGAQLVESSLYIDPAPESRHKLTASFNFNFPIQDKDFLPILDLPAGAKAGEPHAVWSAKRDKLNISWPVLKLPVQEGPAKIKLPGLGQIVERDGLVSFFADPSGVTFMRTIPARDSIFTIKSAEVAQRTDAALNRIHVLKIKTSLYVKPEELLKNLEVIELPEFNSNVATVPFDWAQAPCIPAAAAKQGKKLQLDLKGDLPNSEFELQLPVTAGRYVLIAVKPGLTAANGLRLAKGWTAAARAEDSPPNIDFLHAGHILPKNAKLEFSAHDLDAIQWDVIHVEPAFLSLMAQASDNPFAQPLERLEGSGLGAEFLGKSQSGKIALAQKEPGKAQFATLDVASALQRAADSSSGLCYVILKGYDKGEEKAVAKRLLLLTDVDLVAKFGSNGRLDCFARFIGRKSPAQNALVEILGANGQPVAQGKTDDRGYVSFAGLAGLEKGSAPVAAVVYADDSLAWLPLKDRSRELNFSDFDIAGNHAVSNGITAAVFSQRGLYRPGDTLYFGCMARNGDFSPLPGNAPLYAELMNPVGQKIWESNFEAGQQNLAELKWPSSKTSPTGRYLLNVKTAKNGVVLASESVRIEEFEPDTLKIKVAVPGIKGWLVSENGGNAHIDLQNLYGAPAAGNRVEARIATAKADFSFAEYPGYNFGDPAPFLGGGTESKIGEGQTDEKGNAVFTLPGTLLGGTSAKVTIMAEGFEKGGGRAAGSSTTFLVSPTSKLVGWQPMQSLTNTSFVPQGSKALANYIVIDSSLQKSEWKNLNFSLARFDHVTSLVGDGNGGYRYDSVPRETIIKSWVENIAPNGLDVTLPTNASGSYVLSIADSDGRVLSRLPYNVAGEKTLLPDEPLASSKMRLQLDKNQYEAGDEMRIAYSLPYDAAGLITLEREGIEAFMWVDGHAGDNMATLRIPENFAGKGYVVATFMRSPDSNYVYMNPLAYAVQPFTANMASHALDLQLLAPKSARPGQKLQVTIKANAPCQAILFAVDEGILQLTNYQNPNPLAELLGNRALDVKTLQTADLLLPGKMFSRPSAFGGGAQLGKFGARFQNPFKRRNEPPVAFWSGLLSLQDKNATVEIPVPDWYAGKLRIVAAASSQNGAGAAYGEAVIAGDLVLTPHLPLALAPQDQFAGALTLANNTSSPMDVDLQMIASSGLKIIAPLSPRANIPAGKEVVLPFKAQALPELGEASVIFKARYANTDIAREARLSIRPPAPMRATIQAGKAAEAGVLPPSRPVFPQFAQSNVSLAGIPIPFANSLGKYLETYPHGCTEQLISRSFAQVLLAPWQPARAAAAGRVLVDSAISAIMARSNGQGVALWDNNPPDLLLTCYAADFLLLLREKGVHANDGLLENLCNAIAWNIALNEPDMQAARASAYGIWILAREGRVVTQMLEELIASLETHGLTAWQNDLAGALVTASRCEMNVPAQYDFSKLKFESAGWFDEYAQQALAMTLMSRYFPQQIDEAAEEQFLSSSLAAVNRGAFSTFSAAQGIRALLHVSARKTGAIMQTNVQCMDEGVTGEYDLEKQNDVVSWTTQVCSRYKITIPDNKRPVYWQIATIGYDKEIPEKAEANGLDITRQYLDMDGAPKKEIRVGDEIFVRVNVTGSQQNLKDIVISDLLPGGFEMVIPSTGDAWPDGVKNLERREDRTLIYADIENGDLELTWRVRAVTPGSYVVPAIYAEAMYAPHINGHSSGGRLEIKAR